jgi:hypothetical protein
LKLETLINEDERMTTSNLTKTSRAQKAASKPSAPPVFDENAPVIPKVKKLTTDFTNTEAMLGSAREALYGYLGDAYCLAAELSRDPIATECLRSFCSSQLRSQNCTVSLKNRNHVQLILLASIGNRYASLRTKYGKVLRLALSEEVAEDSTSFIAWLRARGGVVRVLQSLATAIEGGQPKDGAPPLAIGELMQAIAAKASTMPAAPHKVGATLDGFSVALYYTSPSTGLTHLICDLAEKAAVTAAIRASDEVLTSGPTEVT